MVIVSLKTVSKRIMTRNIARRVLLKFFLKNATVNIGAYATDITAINIPPNKGMKIGK
jgi:hypothetical protein